MGSNTRNFKTTFYFLHNLVGSRIAQLVQQWSVGFKAKESGFDSWQGQEIFHFSTASRRALELTQPSIQWMLGALSLGIKQPGPEAYHSPPSNAEVKNGGATSPLPVHLHGMVLN
jgi:hypothetical protein